MTTDNRTNEPTPNPTAESVIYRVLLESLGEAHDRVSHKINQALRAHSLLSEGIPSEEQVERGIAAIEREAAARALAEVRSTIGAYQENGVWAFDQAVACIERARAAEYRKAVQGEPNDDREAVTKFPAIILDRAFIRWRNVEIDRTGTLPEGFEMFRAGWNRAVAAVNGEHDHIEDGNSYLDCGACEMERKER